MLTHPTHERLTALGLTGMAKALEEQRRQGDLAALNWLVGFESCGLTRIVASMLVSSRLRIGVRYDQFHGS